MILLSPSILAADFACLGDYMRLADAAGTDMFHVDVMDGMFVPNISFGIPIMESVRKITHTPIDVHLMIVRPERYIREFARVGADIITVHYEACDDINAAAALIHECGCKAGISIKPGTDTSVLEPFLDEYDLFLIMTVEPGFGGQKYMNKCTAKISALRAMLNERGLESYIEVDGGITRDNVDTVLDAGANVIVMGSSVFNGDIRDNVAYFKKYFAEYKGDVV
ncbi:MAG: ribulose-phosphate 3-epimerase [Lachnospiraceae bacterium]|nr:ribulose-phosphate 3-epimerase [Lachnospiraceae bacterium]